MIKNRVTEKLFFFLRICHLFPLRFSFTLRCMWLTKVSKAWLLHVVRGNFPDGKSDCFVILAKKAHVASTVPDAWLAHAWTDNSPPQGNSELTSENSRRAKSCPGALTVP